MTTYTMVVKSPLTINRAIEFTRDELHEALNALEMCPDADGATIDKFVKICYDYTDFEDIESDQDQPVLQGLNE